MATPAPQSATLAELTPRLPVADAGLVAAATLEGFNRHYAVFRDCARAAKGDFEAANWMAIHHASRERIDYYDRRVLETVERLEREFGCARINESRWEEIKLR